MNLTMQRQSLLWDDSEHTVWETITERIYWPPEQTVLLLCDVWNNHWCRGAVERLEAMIPRMNAVVQSARKQGVTIIHAPSGTLDVYANTPARRRILDRLKIWITLIPYCQSTIRMAGQTQVKIPRKSIHRSGRGNTLG